MISVAPISTTRSISFIPDRLYDRNEYIQYPRDQPGQRRATHRIVCTAAAAAWLPHSKRCDTCVASGQGTLSRT